MTKLNVIIAKLGRHDEQLESIDALLVSRPNDVDQSTAVNTGIERLPVSDDDELALLEQFINEPTNFKALVKISLQKYFVLSLTIVYIISGSSTYKFAFRLKSLVDWGDRWFLKLLEK